MTPTELEAIRQIIREELALHRHSEGLFQDQAYLVATTTPKERNRRFHASRKAKKEAAS